MSYFHYTLKSSNVKTGPIPVTTSSKDTCPASCGQYETCYAKSGPLAMHWSAVNNGKRGGDLDALCNMIESLPVGQLWRHNQAGDLPGFDAAIDTEALSRIVNANMGRSGFTYTHKPMTAENVDAIRDANAKGFCINLSADTLAEADAKQALGIAPVAVVLPWNATENTATPAGNKVVLCPATQKNELLLLSIDGRRKNVNDLLNFQRISIRSSKDCNPSSMRCCAQRWKTS